jgi:hypothetical protein
MPGNARGVEPAGATPPAQERGQDKPTTACRTIIAEVGRTNNAPWCAWLPRHQTVEKAACGIWLHHGTAHHRSTPHRVGSCPQSVQPCARSIVHPRSATGIADRVRNIRVNHHLLKKHAVCMNDVRGPNKLRALGGYTFTNKRIAGTHFCPLWTQNATTWMRTQYATTWMWHSFDSPCATANTATPRGVNACGCGNTLRGQFTRG